MASREIVSSDKYPLKDRNSPAVKIPGLIFCSGQVGKSKDIGEATVEALSALKDVLELGGSSLEKVVKYNSESLPFIRGRSTAKQAVFILDLDNFDAMNKAFVEYLPNPKPARTCIQAARLPADSIIEIECIAQV